MSLFSQNKPVPQTFHWGEPTAYEKRSTLYGQQYPHRLVLKETWTGYGKQFLPRSPYGKGTHFFLGAAITPLSLFARSVFTVVPTLANRKAKSSIKREDKRMAAAAQREKHLLAYRLGQTTGLAMTADVLGWTLYIMYCDVQLIRDILSLV